MIRTIILGCCALTMSASVFAQSDLVIYRPTSAKGITLGGLYTGFGNDLDVIDYNIAGLSQIKTIEMYGTHQLYYADMTYSEVNVGMPFDFGAFSVGFKYNGIPPIAINTVSEGVVVNSGSITLYDLGVNVGYAMPIAKGFSVGGRLHYFNSVIDTYSAWTLSADIGFMYQTRLFDLSSGRLIGKDDIAAKEEVDRAEVDRRHRAAILRIRTDAAMRKEQLDNSIRTLSSNAITLTASSVKNKEQEERVQRNDQELKAAKASRLRVDPELRKNEDAENDRYRKEADALTDHYADRMETYLAEKQMRYMNEGEKLEFQKNLVLKKLNRRIRKRVAENIDVMVRVQYDVDRRVADIDAQKKRVTDEYEKRIADMRSLKYETDRFAAPADIGKAIADANRKIEIAAKKRDRSTNEPRTESAEELIARVAMLKNVQSLLVTRAALADALARTNALLQSEQAKLQTATSNNAAAGAAVQTLSNELQQLSEKTNDVNPADVKAMQKKYDAAVKDAAKAAPVYERLRTSVEGLTASAGAMTEALNEQNTAVFVAIPIEFLTEKRTIPDADRAKVEDLERSAGTFNREIDNLKKQIEELRVSLDGQVIASQRKINELEEEEERERASLVKEFRQKVASDEVRAQIRESIWEGAEIEEINKLDLLAVDIASKKDAVQVEIDALLAKKNTVIQKLGFVRDKFAKLLGDAEDKDELYRQYTGALAKYGAAQTNVDREIVAAKQRFDALDKDMVFGKAETVAGTLDTIKEKFISLGLTNTEESALFSQQDRKLNAIESEYARENLSMIKKVQTQEELVRNAANERTLAALEAVKNEQNAFERAYAERRFAVKTDTVMKLKEVRYKGDANAVFAIRAESINKRKSQFSEVMEELDAGIKREQEFIAIERIRREREKKLVETAATYSISVEKAETELRDYAVKKIQPVAESYKRIAANDDKLRNIPPAAEKQKLETANVSLRAVIDEEYAKATAKNDDTQLTALIRAYHDARDAKEKAIEQVNELYEDRMLEKNENYLRTRSNLFASVMVSHLGLPLTYSGSGFVGESSMQPITVHGEFAIRPIDDLTFGIGVTGNVRDLAFGGHIGMKYQFFSMFNVRAGYQLTMKGGENFPYEHTLAFGGGIAFPLRISFLKVNLGIDYAFMPGDLFGLAFSGLGHRHALSATIKMMGF
ncbi:MAG: hypothetical protein AABZ39_20430 [Spirochaetota bacterium]